MNHLRLFILSLACTGFIACAEAPVPQQSLDGSWRPVVYQLHQGEREPVDGILFLDDGVWSVVFFVLDESGEPVRGSGEGGSYTVDGDQLALTHHFVLSAGQAVGKMHQDPLRMELYGDGGAAGVEMCSFTIADDRLTLFFPSQNEMIFERIG